MLVEMLRFRARLHALLPSCRRFLALHARLLGGQAGHRQGDGAAVGVQDHMSLPPPGKQYNENESSRADIFKEIDILIALKHDNIVFMKGAASVAAGPEALHAGLECGAARRADLPTCRPAVTLMPLPAHRVL